MTSFCPYPPFKQITCASLSDLHSHQNCITVAVHKYHRDSQSVVITCPSAVCECNEVQLCYTIVLMSIGIRMTASLHCITVVWHIRKVTDGVVQTALFKLVYLVVIKVLENMGVFRHLRFPLTKVASVTSQDQESEKHHLENTLWNQQ